jgi:hypothetical protein
MDYEDFFEDFVYHTHVYSVQCTYYFMYKVYVCYTCQGRILLLVGMVTWYYVYVYTMRMHSVCMLCCHTLRGGVVVFNDTIRGPWAPAAKAGRITTISQTDGRYPRICLIVRSM